ncbi:MAG: metalloregulator ArsR/SmtB family transcription factor [Endozoicomonas sp. (ex Botrylloides leachii)]|nr:metalloregulator ArsR/SmtB family transcription factor [Endozoicomonas sp. (ex Botrylloides leachii)]
MQCTLSDPNLLNTLELCTTQQNTLAELAKAVGHPARVKILHILSLLEQQGGCLNADLVEHLQLAQSTVSEHLSILKKANLVKAITIGKKSCYVFNRERLNNLNTLTNTLFYNL